MIGFIGSLFVGIFGILGKLLPGKKKDYFLQFDEAADKVQEKTQNVAEKVQEKTEAATEKLASAAEAATSNKGQKKPTAKSEKKAKAPAAKVQPQKPAPAPAANGKVAPKSAEPVKLFAPNYLLPKPTATRRRPGANMSMFVQMSREMNIRR
jgi:hypothetical protein